MFSLKWERKKLFRGYLDTFSLKIENGQNILAKSDFLVQINKGSENTALHKDLRQIDLWWILVVMWS